MLGSLDDTMGIIRRQIANQAAWCGRGGGFLDVDEAMAFIFSRIDSGQHGKA